MDIYTLDKAVAEAERFIERAQALKSAHASAYQGHGAAGTPRTFYDFPKERAAARRSSMDLTRALADMRRPS